ncbi:MAG: response regulator [Pirellulaceae bacterium]|nr:response regulator [Pirellulaceae bacterium]
MSIPPAWQTEGRRPRVLLVDDDREILDAVQYAMENEDYEVHIARDGNQGIATAESVKPDLMIVDMMMPKRSGFLVLERLRETYDRPLRAIMVTANEGDRHREYAKLLGATEYIIKPFVMGQLLEAARRILNEPLPDMNA